MATINNATCYGLQKKGAIAPGYVADLLLLDQLDTVQIFEVYKNGQLVAQNGEYLGPDLRPASKTSKLLKSVQLTDLSLQDFQIPLQNPKANLIEINPNSLVTNHVVEEVVIHNGYFTPSVEKDQLKLAVVERHLKTGNVGMGIVKGFGLQYGAVAASIAHDSHNIMVVGTNDDDILTAVKELEKMQGGIVVVKDGRILASLALPIGGLMTDAPISEIQSSLKKIEKELETIGFDGSFDFLLTLAFLSLPVIPDIKLTHQGLFDVKNFKHITVQA